MNVTESWKFENFKAFMNKAFFFNNSHPTKKEFWDKRKPVSCHTCLICVR